MSKNNESSIKTTLSGKKIVLATSASINIYRIPDLIKNLRNEGAEVYCGMSTASAELINPDLLQWASGHDVITRISGNIEHITLFDKNTVLVIAPATYNTIGKIASGVADNIPSLFYSYAMGNKNPVVIAPVINKTMLENPVNKENIKKLNDLGVHMVDFTPSDDNIKLWSDKIIDYIYRALYGDKLNGKNIMLVCGKSESAVDPERVITNKSDTLTGYMLARYAFRFGAGIITYIGNSEYKLPSYVQLIEKTDIKDIIREINTFLGVYNYDYVIISSSLSDFDAVENKTKLDSSEPQTLSLKPRNKERNLIRKLDAGVTMVLFTTKNDKTYNSEAFEKSDPDLVIMTGTGAFTSGDVSGDYTFIYGEHKDEIKSITKEELAINIYNYLENKIRRNQKMDFKI
ncbi:flavoprotein [Acidiplasma sp.]|uniref:flavoprotein n=1 Tax=Acidiplasma sp. TaxID=1872114 RepID=UPI003164891D